MGNVLLNYDPRLPLEKFAETEADRAVILKELFEGPGGQKVTWDILRWKESLRG